MRRILPEVMLTKKGKPIRIMSLQEAAHYCHVDSSYSYRSLTDEENHTDYSFTSSPCFIATAAYGTPMAEEINVLRWYRDTNLKKNKMGRNFVAFYYQHSQNIANFIRNKPSLRFLVRLALKPIVSLIQIHKRSE